MYSMMPLWIIGLPVISSPFIYFGGRVRRPAVARWMTLLVLVAAWVVLISVVRDHASLGTFGATLGLITLRVDGITLVLAALVLTLASLAVVYSGVYLKDEPGQEKFYALLVILVGAMIGLASAADLFNLWIWFETMAVSSYLLVGFYRQQPGSLEAAVKYLVQSAVGSILVLMGIGLVLANTGLLDLELIRSAPATPALVLAAGLFTVGFGIKIALVPLHTWLPDAHAQAPSPISAMLSGVVIEAGLIALLRTVGALAHVSSSWPMLLIGLGLLNMVLGNLMALRQQQVKRLLAFSSLSHVGYMLLGLGITLNTVRPEGAQGAFLHLLTHGLMKGLAFLAVGALLYALYLAKERHNPLTRADLNGAARRYPLVAFTLSLALLGLGGLPPLAGFVSKWQIFVAGFTAHEPILQVVVVFAALNSVLSLAYYAPLINALYRRQMSPAVEKGVAIPLSMQAPLVLAAIAIVLIGLWPSLMSGLTGPAAASFLTMLGGPALP